MPSEAADALRLKKREIELMAGEAAAVLRAGDGWNRAMRSEAAGSGRKTAHALPAMNKETVHAE